jgi:biotin operon repressor/predicted phosphodiesterase
MTENLPDLTEQQSSIINELPAGTAELADALRCSRSTVRDHITEIRNSGIEIDYDHSAGKYFISDERKPKLERISSKHKSQITREANEIIEAEHSHLLRRLENSEPLRPGVPTINAMESFVAVFGDLHFGDVVEDDNGTVLYDMDTAAESVDQFAEKCLEIHDIERRTQTYDHCVLALTGDIATGTHIYSGQIHDIEAYLGDQVTRSAQKLIDLILTLADRFERVDVYGVLGNHGLDRASAARGSNTDLLTYRWMQDALRRMDVENISITIADGSHSLTTKINGKVFHLRHGQQGQRHVDKTAASSRDWRGIWANVDDPDDPENPYKNGFDIAARGHFHEPSLDWLMNTYPVVTAPSPKPGDEFAEQIGQPDVGAPRHLGWCFGVGSGRRMTFKRLIDDGSLKDRDEFTEYESP